MHIQNAQYSGANNDVIQCVIDGESKSVPIDPANRHYEEIMRQVADEGLVIAEPDDIVFPEEPS
jgi:hypothetical protein